MSKKVNTSLNEIMGRNADHFEKHGIEFHHLPELLGEQMPPLQFHALGRMRLMNALKHRFGAGWRNKPGINKLMSKFDEAAKKEVEYHKILQKYGRK